MTLTQYYTATTLDGFIADASHSHGGFVAARYSVASLATRSRPTTS